MGEQPTVPLGSLLENGQASYGIVQPGQHLEGGVPIVRVKDISNGLISVAEPLRVEPRISDKHGGTVLRGGELLLTIVGSIGESAIVPSEMAGWNVARAIAVLRPIGVSAKWLQQVLRSPGTRFAITRLLNTTVQATLNLADLKQIPIPVPSRGTRDAIVAVLGALDDKIAANEEAIRCVEELADSFYIREAREVPLSEQTFGDIAEVGGGGTPKTKIDEYWNGDTLWATPTDVTGLNAPYLSNTERKITEAGLAACSSKLYPAGSIFMTSRATIGAFAIAQVASAVNQGFIVVNAHNGDMQWWIYHQMRNRVAEFISYANGATFLELSRGRFKELFARVPTPERARRFSELVAPMHSAGAQLVIENKYLASTRDSLLPLLMSGKIRVKDAEKVVEEAT